MALEPSRPSLSRTVNPLLIEHEAKTVDLERLEKPVVARRRVRAGHQRRLVDMRRVENARQAIEGLTTDLELYGFTKGQFSLLDMLCACLELTGPAILNLSTWTAARHEIERLRDLYIEGKMTEVRFLTDASFARRDPTAAHMIRVAFGVERVRIAQTHAKFALFGNEKWKLVLRTSMNLNMNPRFEDFQLGHDPQMYDFINGIMDEIWTKQKGSLRAEDAAEARRVFVQDL